MFHSEEGGWRGLGKVRLVISFENPELTGHISGVGEQPDGPTRPRKSSPPTFSGGRLRPSLGRQGTSGALASIYRDGRSHSQTLVSGGAWPASLLHLDCLPPSPVEGKGKVPARRSVKTIGEVCRQQTQALIESLILVAHDLLQQGQVGRSGVRSAVCQATRGAARPPDAFNLSVQNTTIEDLI